MKFTIGAKSKGMPPALQAGLEGKLNHPSSPASAASSFISVGAIMEQRERPRRRTEIDVDVSDSFGAQSLMDDNGSSAEDELFDAYRGYIDAISRRKASVERSRPQGGGKGARKAPPREVLSNAYVKSMHEILHKKRQDQLNSKRKATGVTRRLMDEANIAKENMHLYNRLIKVMPSPDVDRRLHKKDFSRSRGYIEKMSRYDSANGSLDQSAKPAWDDNWVGCVC
jgi:hypothetical protein